MLELFVEPSGQYAPPGHSAVQLFELRLDVLPNLPAGQREHAVEPSGENVPDGQGEMMEGLVELAAEHDCPAGQRPLQMGVVLRPARFEKVPGGHGEQNAEPSVAYVPSAQAE